MNKEHVEKAKAFLVKKGFNDLYFNGSRMIDFIAEQMAEYHLSQPTTDLDETTYVKFRKSIEKVFDKWNSSLGKQTFCKIGNDKHFYFVRYEGFNIPNSMHSYEDVVKLFEQSLPYLQKPVVKESDAV